ncbi:MAG: glycosyltransferase [Nitrososphaerota archaeon]
MADIVIVDTLSQALYFEQKLGVPSFKIQVVYVGCDDNLFKPMKVSSPERPVILFYGTFLPLHGVDVIIRAANLMRDEPVLFRIIGQGQEYDRVYALAKYLNITNVEFIPWVPMQELPLIINQATICLGGPFGGSEKARRVITSKTFQCMAAGKPTIVGDTPANRELFTHGENVWMCPVNDPVALATAIRTLLNAPLLRAKLGAEGRKIIQQTSGNLMIAQSIRRVVEMAAQRRT